MWKKIIHFIETEVDDTKYAIERLAGLQTPLKIKPYTGYANSSSIRFGGRVLVTKDIPEINASDSSWRNFLNMTRNWFTDEVPGAELEVTFCNETFRVTADEEGFFKVELPFERTNPAAYLRPEAEVRLTAPESDIPVTTTLTAVAPGFGSEFGIISDIDDTVIHTGATDYMTMIRNTLLGNAHTRVVFEGVSAFYAALVRGRDGKHRNPVFFVTSSPWNLYDLITEVFELRSIPPGPLFMDDWGIDEDRFIRGSHHSHKKSAIRGILDFYPYLNFVLIGDSGQEDPEIYTDLIEEYPGRILAIYIRDVTTDERDTAVRKLREKANQYNVDLILTDNTSELAEDAAEKGLIRKTELPAIQGQRLADIAEHEESS